MRGRELPRRFVELAALSAAFVGAACIVSIDESRIAAGPPKPDGPEGGSDADSGDADAAVEAGPRFCDGVSDASFCEDFTDGLLGRFQDEDTVGGFLERITDDRVPSSVLDARIEPDTRLYYERARLSTTLSFPSGAATIELKHRAMLGATTGDAGPGVIEVLTIDFTDAGNLVYQLGVYLSTDSQLQLFEFDFASSQGTRFLPFVPISNDQWVTLRVRFDLGARRLELQRVTGNTGTVAQTGDLTRVPAALPTQANVHVGLLPDSPQDGVEARYDDIVVRTP